MYLLHYVYFEQCSLILKHAVRVIFYCDVYMFSHVFNFSADEIISILNLDCTYQLTNNSVHGRNISFLERVKEQTEKEKKRQGKRRR